MSLADNTSVTMWLFRLTGEPHLAVGPSLLPALWYGMRCLTMSEIQHISTRPRHISVLGARQKCYCVSRLRAVHIYY